jgi:AcrR family transcriptional regulator|tara:strand:- start:182 stop:790 length:609 start_codon:yes stop_codon:yes gene_type:complete
MNKEQRIEQIKKKTFNLIAHNGSLDSIRTKDIASAIGASEATIFKYFDSKEDILESVIKEYIQSRPLNFNSEEVTTLKGFKKYLHKILDFTFDTSSNRNKNVSLIIQTSLKKHPISNWNYKNLKDEVWSFIEDRIEYGKKHWNFAKSIDSKIQSRLFYYAPIMFYIQMEIFDSKSIEKFDYEKVKKIHIENFIKVLTENQKK